MTFKTTTQTLSKSTHSASTGISDDSASCGMCPPTRTCHSSAIVVLMAYPAEILGRPEIAHLLDMEKRTPNAWHSRGLLPDPDIPSVNGGPAWFRPTIIKWAVETGRLPAHLAEEGAAYGEVAKVRGGRRPR